MLNNGKVEALVYQLVDEINRQLPADQQIDSSSESVLYGESGVLDSMGLVTFVADLEQMVLDEFGKSINVANEETLAMVESPFLTIGTVVRHVTSLLEKTA